MDSSFSSRYALHPQSRVWRRPDYAGIGHDAAADAVRRMAALVAQAKDLSVLSPEMRRHAADPALRSHASGVRANLLRPFLSLLQGSDVLEISAGCGALTRFLGESGARLVLAVEGHMRRAGVARARCRDLSNVTVLAERFDRFESAQRFDVVVLVGAAEQAGLLFAGEDPLPAMLRRARDLLKPGGHVLLAVDNQVGLRFFAGAPERQSGTAMFGIEDRYDGGQSRTYGRAELADRIRHAGFRTAHFMAPFPDCQCPVSIVTEPGFQDEVFDAGALAAQTFKRDPELPERNAFSMERAWPVLFRNRMALDLANSFLVSACKERKARTASETHVLAYHYATERRPAFCKETRFVRTPDGTVEVRHRGLGGGQPDPGCGKAWVSHVLPDAEDYHPGRLLSEQFIDIVTRDGWRLSDVQTFLEKYITAIDSHATCEGARLNLDALKDPVPGAFFDLVPQNIMERPDGSLQVFDQEWALSEPLELGFLVYRALLLLSGSITRLGAPDGFEGKTWGDFTSAAFDAAGMPVGPDDLRRYSDAEGRIRECLAGYADKDFLEGWPRQSLPWKNLGQAARDCEQTLAALSHAVNDRDRQVAELSRAIDDSNRQVAELNCAVNDRDRQVAGLRRTVSDRDRWLKEAHRRANEQSGRLAEVDRLLKEREARLGDLRRAVDEAEKHVADLARQADERDRQWVEAQRAASQYAGELSATSHALQEARAGLAVLTSSLTWRLSHPLRALYLRGMEMKACLVRPRAWFRRSGKASEEKNPAAGNAAPVALAAGGDVGVHNAGAREKQGGAGTMTHYVEDVLACAEGFVLVSGWADPRLHSELELRLQIDGQAGPRVPVPCRYKRPDVDDVLGCQGGHAGFMALLRAPPLRPHGAIEIELDGTLSPRHGDVRWLGLPPFLDRVLDMMARLATAGAGESFPHARMLYPSVHEVWQEYLSGVAYVPLLDRRKGAKPARSIVTVLHRDYPYLMPQLLSFLPLLKGPEAEVILVANEVADVARMVERVAAFQEIHGIDVAVYASNRNSGFAHANNYGASVARSDQLFFVNPDIFPVPHAEDSWLRFFDPMAEKTLRGARLYYGNGALMHAGMYVVREDVPEPQGRETNAWLRVEHYGKGLAESVRAGGAVATAAGEPDSAEPRRLGLVTAALWGIRRDTFTSIGGLPTEYLFAYYEDADFCLKLVDSEGSVELCPQARFYHLEGIGSVASPKTTGLLWLNRFRFSQKFADHPCVYSAEEDLVLL